MLLAKKIFEFHGTFETVHEIQKFFLAKSILLKHYENGDKIFFFFRNKTQGLPNPGFMQEKVQKGDFLKKDSRELNFFCFVLSSYQSPKRLER